VSAERSAPLAAVILAAGQGTRMKSALIKILHPLAGRQMIRHVLLAVQEVGADRVVCVVGYQREQVKDALGGLPSVEFAVQEDQRGTGHALQCASSALEGFDGDVLVVCADTPLLTRETLHEVVRVHREDGARATLLVVELADPSGYGRVVLDSEGGVQRIVEQKDADEPTRRIRLINTGVYCFAWRAVGPLLERLSADNAQGEMYLTDVMQMLAEAGTPARSVLLSDPQELMGVNDRAQLAEAEAVLRDRIRRRLMREGVTFVSPDTTLIDADVQIGPDTVIYPGVIIEGVSSVGRESVIGPFTRIANAHLGKGVELKGWNLIAHTTIPHGSIVQPYVRQGAD
jgi:bifunctional UDP-N-acetylglucosamine pyrophosphorylase / glucosamine-1-phosphate N-acetyltransferase